MNIESAAKIISVKNIFSMFYPYTLFRGNKSSYETLNIRKPFLWSKTSLNTGGVGRTREDPPTCKMRTFFLMSLTLTEPSFNNFQLNGAKIF